MCRCAPDLGPRSRSAVSRPLRLRSAAYLSASVEHTARTIATQAETPADSALALLSDSALQNRGVMAAMTAEVQQDLKFSALATASMAAEAQEANEEDDDAKPRRKPSVES